uniref:Uncharacterized protein n=1 Tax=Leersia perrieri TaxID=77586 RepID=A0A0D9XL00_9ORYZ
MPPAPSAAFPHRRHLLLRLRLPPFTCCRYRPLRHHTAADPTRRCIRRSTSMSPPPIHLATPHRRSTSAPRHAASQIHRSINALPHLPIHLAAPRHDLQGRPAMSTASTTVMRHNHSRFFTFLFPLGIKYPVPNPYSLSLDLPITPLRRRYIASDDAHAYPFATPSPSVRLRAAAPISELAASILGAFSIDIAASTPQVPIHPHAHVPPPRRPRQGATDIPGDAPWRHAAEGGDARRWRTQQERPRRVWRLRRAQRGRATVEDAPRTAEDEGGRARRRARRRVAEVSEAKTARMEAGERVSRRSQRQLLHHVAVPAGLPEEAGIYGVGLLLSSNTKTRGVPIVDARTEAEAKKIYNISKVRNRCFSSILFTDFPIFAIPVKVKSCAYVVKNCLCMLSLIVLGTECLLGNPIVDG